MGWVCTRPHYCQLLRDVSDLIFDFIFVLIFCRLQRDSWSAGFFLALFIVLYYCSTVTSTEGLTATCYNL